MLLRPSSMRAQSFVTRDPRQRNTRSKTESIDIGERGSNNRFAFFYMVILGIWAVSRHAQFSLVCLFCFFIFQHQKDGSRLCGGR